MKNFLLTIILVSSLNSYGQLITSFSIADDKAHLVIQKNNKECEDFELKISKHSNYAFFEYNNDSVYLDVEKSATLDEDQLLNYFASNMEKSDKRINVTSSFYLRFIINENGDVVEKGIQSWTECGKNDDWLYSELMGTLANSNFSFKPAIVNGKNVSSIVFFKLDYYEIPFLENDK